MLTDVLICVVVINPGVAFCLDHHIEQAMRRQLLHRAHLSSTSYKPFAQGCQS